MCFFHLSFLLMFSLLAPLHVKCVGWDIVPFEKNYVSLWGKNNIQILDQSREVQLTLNAQSGKSLITIADTNYIYFKKIKSK
jgi:hypothetical protein